MGFSLSWIAFKGLTRDEVLARTGFRATGPTDDYGTDTTPFVLGVFPTGWIAIISSDYRYASSKGLGHFSGQRATALGCRVEEHVMWSAAALSVDGRPVWSVEHDSKRGIEDLSSSGTLPTEFEPIRARLFAKQKADAPGPFRTDFVFDVPVELVHALTGFRHDETPTWGDQHYELLIVAP